MANGPTLFLLSLIEITAVVLPAIVAATCLRRSLRSQGFNRWLYLYVTVYAGLLISVVLATGPSATILHGISVAGAWFSLPLWLWVRDLTREMPTRGYIARGGIGARQTACGPKVAQARSGCG